MVGEGIARLGVEALRVLAVDRGRQARERAVDEDRHVRDLAPAGQFVQRRHQLLGPPHGERRHDHPPAAGDRARHRLAQGAHRLGLRGMVAVAVRALEHQHVHPGRHVGVAQDRAVRPPEVPAEADPQHAAAAAELEGGQGRAEDVPRVVVADLDALGQRPRLAVAVRHEALERRHDVGRPVERAPRRLPLRLRPPIDVLEVTLHQEGAVREQRPRQVPGRGGQVDGAAETLAHQRRQVAGVVEVRVRHHHRLQVAGREGEAAVDAVRLVAVPLEQAAVEQPVVGAEAQAVTRAGHRLRGALEGEGEGKVRHRLA